MGELGHRLLQGEMEMQRGRKRRESERGLRRGGESEAEQQKYTQPSRTQLREFVYLDFSAS